MKKRVLKIVVGAALALAIVLTGAFLYISSGHFIKTHVLPRVSKSIGCDVQAGEVVFSALSSIELKNLRIGSEADPLMQAGTVRIRYRALSLFTGMVQVDEVLLDHVRVAATRAKLEALAKPIRSELPHVEAELLHGRRALQALLFSKSSTRSTISSPVHLLFS